MPYTFNVEGKIDRKYMAHFLDLYFTGHNQDTEISEGTWTRLGKDLEEYNIELNPDTETSKNILGEETFKHNGYEVSADASPFYAYTDDALFSHLQYICDNRSKDDTCKTYAVEVHLWDEVQPESGTTTPTGKFVAYKQMVNVVPQSYGGDTSGYQIPFSVYWEGERVKGFMTRTTDSSGVVSWAWSAT